MASFTKRSFVALLLLGLIAWTPCVVAQEAAEVEPPVLEVTEPPTLESTADTAEDAVVEEPAQEAADSSSDSAESDAEEADATASETETSEESSEVTETPTEDSDAENAEAMVDDTDPSEQEATENETAVDSATEESTEAESYDYGALISRSPQFLAVTHPAVIHFPIALWVLGALFVVIGLVVPTWRQQIPMACLLIGTAGAIVASLTGWWYADLQGYAEWNEIDWDDTLCRHRWIGVAMSIVALFVSLLALYSAKAESWFGGFLWRTGLILLALVACFEGHIGGELIHSTSIEEAFVEWINPSE